MEKLLSWWNLVFELPVLATMLYALILATGTVSVEHDHDLDHDVTLDHSLDHDIEHDLGHGDVSTNEVGALTKTLDFLGFGKVPLSILLTCWLLIWGFTGYASNALFDSGGWPVEIYFWLSLALATLVSIFLTGRLATAFARILPKTESYGISASELVGGIGVAILPITPTFGKATVTDRFGTQHLVFCQLEAGEEEIPINERIVLQNLDPSTNQYQVIRESSLDRILRSSPKRELNTHESQDS